MLRFHTGYFLAAAGVLALETGITLFVHDKFVRPYGGDFLATIFLFWLVKTFVLAPNRQIVTLVLLTSYLIEALQYVNLLTQLGLQHSRLARIVLGSHFEWTDMLAYTLGALVAVGIERVVQAGRPRLSKGMARQQVLP